VTAPSVAASATAATLARTGGGSDTTPLLLGGIAFIGAGGALTLGIHRRARRRQGE
jgi:hypothetical protein